MSNVMGNLMWRHQGAFQSSVDVAVRDAFSALDQAFEARAFLVGFLREGDPALAPVCIEPEEIAYEAAAFSQVPGLAENLARQHPERRAPAPRQPDQQKQDDLVFRQSWQRAMEQTMAALDEGHGWRSFASWPVDVGSYRVLCVLQLSRGVLESYYSLTRDTVEGYHRVATSLLDALVGAFLTGCSQALGGPDPGGSARVIDRTVSELHRNAGRNLMEIAGLACHNYESVHTLYDAICELSAARYEGSSLEGRMVLAAPDHPNVETIVRFDKPVSLTSTKAARKILEVVTVGLSALSDGSRVYGLGRLRGSYEETREDLFVAEFIDHHAWQVSHAGRPLMRVQYGQPGLPVQPIAESKLTSTIARIFKEIPKEDVLRLRSLIVAATRQHHGTLLVVSDHAAEEAKRLAIQSTLIEPIRLTEELVEALSAIDGALLLDPAGTCHAIGAILDGLACDKGTSSRGARFNSAIRYIETATTQFTHRCMAVVVSADGPTDIIPELLPQIPRSLILRQIKGFAALKEQYPVSRQDFNRFLRWFQGHKSYLWSDAAAEINRIRRDLELGLEPSNVSIVWRKIEGNPDLDDSYFSDE